MPAKFAAITLHALRAAAAPTLEQGQELPSRLVVFPWGKHETRRGTFIVSDLTAQVFEANQAKMRLDGRIALDFEHNTLPGTEAFKSSAEPRPIAALAVCKVIPGEGIVFEDIQWTPQGREALQGGHYQDLSPSPFRDKEGNVIGLHSVALCRHGEVDGLTLHAAASPRVAEYLAALSADFTPSESLLTPPMKEALLKLLAALGITATESDNEEALTAALSAAASKVATMQPKEEKPAGLSAADEVTQLRKELLIAQATRDGKVIPLSAAAIAATPLSALTELVAAAKPGTVNTSARTAGGTRENKEDENQPAALSAETLALADRLGLTADEIRKFAPPTE